MERMFLPVNQMLQLDRVVEIALDRIVCELDIANHWVLPLHFPGDPIFPGTLFIEAAGQAVAVWAWHAGLRGRPRLVRVSAKFHSPVLPQDQVVRLSATVRRRKNVFQGSATIMATERKVAEITSTVAIIPPLVVD